MPTGAFPVAQVVKSPPPMRETARDLGSIPGLGRSSGGGNVNPLQYPRLDNPHGQRSLAGYSPWGSQRVRHNCTTKMPTESVMPSSRLILCRPLLLPPSIFPSIRVFSNESALRIRWSKYWSFSFSISPASEHPGLISFRMDWLDFLAVQGTLKSLL